MRITISSEMSVHYFSVLDIELQYQGHYEEVLMRTSTNCCLCPPRRRLSYHFPLEEFGTELTRALLKGLTSWLSALCNESPKNFDHLNKERV